MARCLWYENWSSAHRLSALWEKRRKELDAAKRLGRCEKRLFEACKLHCVRPLSGTPAALKAWQAKACAETHHRLAQQFKRLIE